VQLPEWLKGAPTVEGNRDELVFIKHPNGEDIVGWTPTDTIESYWDGWKEEIQAGIMQASLITGLTQPVDTVPYMRVYAGTRGGIRAPKPETE
jgi:hypothetical protein